VAGHNGWCGLRETHAGRLQWVSDSSTVALFSFGCVLCFVVCDVCFWLLLCLCRRCCVAIVGVAELWIVLLLLLDLCWILAFLFQCVGCVGDCEGCVECVSVCVSECECVSVCVCVCSCMKWRV